MGRGVGGNLGMGCGVGGCGGVCVCEVVGGSSLPTVLTICLNGYLSALHDQTPHRSSTRIDGSVEPLCFFILSK